MQLWNISTFEPFRQFLTPGRSQRQKTLPFLSIMYCLGDATPKHFRSFILNWRVTLTSVIWSAISSHSSSLHDWACYYLSHNSNQMAMFDSTALTRFQGLRPTRLLFLSKQRRQRRHLWNFPCLYLRILQMYVSYKRGGDGRSGY